MNRAEKEETRTILNMTNYIKREITRIFKIQDFQMDSLKEENVRLRKSLEEVESDGNES